MKKILHNVSFSFGTLTLAIIAYVILFIFDRKIFFLSLDSVLSLFIKILPFVALTFFLLAFANYFITSEQLLRHLQGGKFKKWFFIVAGGIISAGPVYMWYPLLADLRKKGLNHGVIACFLYTKAIKLPLVPLLVFYFGWKYFIVITFLMILFSIIQGALINKLMGTKYESSHSL